MAADTPWATYRLIDFMHAEIDNPYAPENAGVLQSIAAVGNRELLKILATTLSGYVELLVQRNGAERAHELVSWMRAYASLPGEIAEFEQTGGGSDA